MSSASSPPTAALVADAIARIEERRNALDRLADKGMEMAKRLVAGEVVQIAGRKPFVDPARAFAVISRAVRFCLALANRLDEALVALLRGGPIPNLAILAPDAPPAREVCAAQSTPKPPADTPGPRERVVCAVDAAIDAEAGDRDSAERMRAYVQEHLTEGEDYDALLHQPWQVVARAICSDLGLHPDWSAWENEEGFKVEPKPPNTEPSAPSAPASPQITIAEHDRSTGPPPEHLSHREG